MSDRLRRRLFSLVYAVHRLLPKQHAAVLYGWPDWDDTVIALEEALRETTLRKITILVSSPDKLWAGRLGPHTDIVHRRSFRGLFRFLTARYVFFTHFCYVPKFPGNVVSVNVWHGMPVKRVGWMAGAGALVPVVRFSAATSPLWRDIVQDSLRPSDGTLVTGLPRNDRLFKGAPDIPARLGLEPGLCRKLIVWLPTYRSSWDGPAGSLRRTHSLGLPDDSLTELDDLLAGHDAICVVKPHPLAVSRPGPGLRRVHVITDDWLLQQGLTLYELLGAADSLITDVSSVYVDYLLLDRPVVHHFPDIREYEAGRGFSLGPIDEYLAGPNTTDADQLLAAFASILQGEDSHAGKRREVTAKFHAHLDGNATGRLLEELGLS